MGNTSNSTLIHSFRQWILTRTSPHYHLFVSEKDENVIVIETDYCRGEVTFFPMDIIQLYVLNLVTNRHVFYLHFQMHTKEHAMSLFEEMLECVQELTDQPPVRVLLSCTSGLTTGFFAQKLNESAELLSLNYEFSAVPFGNLYQTASQYDVILLAPQISYIHETAQQILHNKKVCKIPPKTFAAYDVRAVFADLESLTQPAASHGRYSPGRLPLKQQIRPHKKILTIGLLREDNYYLFTSRIYNEHNDIIYDEVSIKSRISLEDVYDLCDMAFAIYPDIQLTGLSMPGIIDEGRLTLLNQGFDESNVLECLSQKYSRKFILGNDANCIAVGYHSSQDQYHSPCVLFQPSIDEPGGLGSICNGQLIEGYKHVAGEIQYLPTNSQGSHAALSLTPEGTLAWVAQSIVSILCILGPDVLLFSSPLLVQTDELIREIGKYIPTKYIPNIIRLSEVKSYMLLGQMILCTEELDSEQDAARDDASA